LIEPSLSFRRAMKCAFIAGLLGRVQGIFLPCFAGSHRGSRGGCDTAIYKALLGSGGANSYKEGRVTYIGRCSDLYRSGDEAI